MNDVIIRKFKLHNVISALAILTPCAYLLGLSFYQGILSGYGVGSVMFPITTIEAYVYFHNLFTRFFLYVMSLITPVQLVLLVIIMTCIILVILFPNKCKTLIKRLKETKQSEIKEKKESTEIENISKSFLLNSFLFIFLIIFIFWVVFPYLSFQTGRSISKKKVTTYQEKGCYIDKTNHWSNCVKVYIDGEEVIEGLLIACSKDRIAIFIENEVSIIDTNKNYRIVRKY